VSLLIAPAVEAWARARLADVLAREMEHSLDLGDQKPLGSFGLSVTQPPRVQVRVLGAYARQKLRHPLDYVGTSFVDVEVLERIRRRRLHEGDASWIYAWRVSALETVLRRHARTFALAEWPCEGQAEVFVTWHRTHVAPPCTPLFDAVSDCYGDRLNPGRTDVLPGVARQDLVDAMRLLFGHGDPDEHHLQPALEVERAACESVRVAREERDQRWASLT